MKKKLKEFNGLIGCERILKQIELLHDKGTKAIFLAGYHGLGKSSIVEGLATEKKAELIRLQVTEMLSEIDIIGGIDLKSGDFKTAPFVNSILSATQHPDKLYFLLLDEFTRGREEALNILFPILAERKLIINNPYSTLNVIAIPDNIKIFATGNLHDTGQREVGQAEMDRYNVIEILPIKEKDTLSYLLKQKVEDLNESVADILISVYLKSWDLYADGKILAMSIRTLIEATKIGTEYAKTITDKNAVKECLGLTYYGTSQAIFNPAYKRTYDEIIKGVN